MLKQNSFSIPGSAAEHHGLSGLPGGIELLDQVIPEHFIAAFKPGNLKAEFFRDPLLAYPGSQAPAKAIQQGVWLVFKLFRPGLNAFLFNGSTDQFMTQFYRGFISFFLVTNPYEVPLFIIH